MSETCKPVQPLTWAHPYDCALYVDCSNKIDPKISSCEDGKVYLHPTGCVFPQYAPCAGISSNETSKHISFMIPFFVYFHHHI